MQEVYALLKGGKKWGYCSQHVVLQPARPAFSTPPHLLSPTGSTPNLAGLGGTSHPSSQRPAPAPAPGYNTVAYPGGMNRQPARPRPPAASMSQLPTTGAAATDPHDPLGFEVSYTPPSPRGATFRYPHAVAADPPDLPPPRPPLAMVSDGVVGVQIQRFIFMSFCIECFLTVSGLFVARCSVQIHAHRYGRQRYCQLKPVFVIIEVATSRNSNWAAIELTKIHYQGQGNPYHYHSIQRIV